MIGPGLLALLLLLTTAGFAHAEDAFQTGGAVHLDKRGEKWARESLKKMSLEQKIGQMFMIWSQARFLNVDSPEYLRLRDTHAQVSSREFRADRALRRRLPRQGPAAGSGSRCR